MRAHPPYRLLGSLLGFAILAIGCASPQPTPSSSIFPSTRPGQACTVAAKTAAEISNRFALNLLKATGKSGENTLIAPVGLQAALFMAYVGTSGATREQLGSILGYPNDDDCVRESFNRLLGEIDQSLFDSRIEEGRAMFNYLFIPKAVLPSPSPALFIPTRTPELEARYNFPPPPSLDQCIFPLEQDASNWRKFNSVETASPNSVSPIAYQGDASFLIAWSQFKTKFAMPLANPQRLLRSFHPSSGLAYGFPTYHFAPVEIHWADGIQHTLLLLPITAWGLDLILFLPKAGADPGNVIANLTQLPKQPSTDSDTILRGLFLPKISFDQESDLLETVLAQLPTKDGATKPTIPLFTPSNFLREILQRISFEVVPPKTPVFDHKAADECRKMQRNDLSKIRIECPEEKPIDRFPPSSQTITVNRPFLFGLRHTKSNAYLMLGRIEDPRKIAQVDSNPKRAFPNNLDSGR